MERVGESLVSSETLVPGCYYDKKDVFRRIIVPTLDGTDVLGVEEMVYK